MWKFIKGKSNTDIVTIHIPEYGYDVKFKLEPTVLVDSENEEKGMPIFNVTFVPTYIETIKTEGAKPLSEIKDNLRTLNILPPHIAWDMLHIGFIYDETNPNNHKWMINLFKGKEFVYTYIGTQVKVNCPFTTTSWQQEIYHGRFLIESKDLKSIFEKESGVFELVGENNNFSNISTNEKLPDKTDVVSIRYNIHDDVWYCDFKDANKKVISSTPCKKIICNAPIIGSVDFDHPKPKVTAEIYADQISGVGMALDALIIKGK